MKVCTLNTLMMISPIGHKQSRTVHTNVNIGLGKGMRVCLTLPKKKPLLLFCQEGGPAGTVKPIHRLIRGIIHIIILVC